MPVRRLRRSDQSLLCLPVHCPVACACVTGIAAATVAKAMQWPIDVCIPDNANPLVVKKLQNDLGANILLCGRTDPTLVTDDGRELDLTSSADPVRIA